MKRHRRKPAPRVHTHVAGLFAERRVKVAIAGFTLIGLLATGVWRMDAHYAKAGDVKEQLQGVRQDLRHLYNRSEKRALESERRALAREQFDLVRIQQRRRLTDLELTRLRVVTEEIGRIEAEIKAVTDREREAERKY